MASFKSFSNGWTSPKSSSLILVIGTCTQFRFDLLLFPALLHDSAFVKTEAVVSSGRVEKSPHEQEIKFFAKVRCKIALIAELYLQVHFRTFLFVIGGALCCFIDPFAIGEPVLQEPLPLLPVHAC